jgi:5-methyltetrahydrofolate--homocysteine methyltransferase
MSALQELYMAIIEGKDKGGELARKALQEGTPPLDILTEAITPAMTIVGEKMERGEYFIPEVLLAARVADRAAGVVKPLLKQGGSNQLIGKVVIGTVEGDLHSIGKDLVKMLLEAGGFEVIDLGINVPPHKFLTATLEHKADIVAMSALLTTTMQTMRQVIEELIEAGYRNQVKVLVGGAPVTQDFADSIGADGYSQSAAGGARLATSWAKQRRKG